MTPIDQAMAVMEAAFDPYWREAWTRRQVEDALAVPSTYLLLAPPLHGDGPAPGFILARQVLDETELLLIGVRPDIRGRGIGSRLLDTFLDDAEERGAKRVFLEMRECNPAEQIYRSKQFEQIGRRPSYYRTLDGKSVDAITFARAL